MRERDILQKTIDALATAPSTNSSFNGNINSVVRNNPSLSSSSGFGFSQSSSNFDKLGSTNNFGQGNNYNSSSFSGGFNGPFATRNTANNPGSYLSNSTSSGNSNTPAKRVQAGACSV